MFPRTGSQPQGIVQKMGPASFDVTQRTHHLVARSADIVSDYISACLPVSEQVDLETAQKFQNAGVTQELRDTTNTVIRDWENLISQIEKFTAELQDSLGNLSRRRRKRLSGQVDECKRALTSLVQPSISLGVEQISIVDNSSVPGLMGAAVFLLTMKQVVRLDEIIEGRRATARLVNVSDEATTKNSSIFRSLVDVGNMIHADLSYTLKSSPEERAAQVSKKLLSGN
ncbi:hypothetical protein SCHPADRAFT_673487 [Schizopora paradoxa]|uniref:Uncharacterized protein n=1 Tax=Schizopora paradoxa TaxID=27342 RepID=A0A0H2R573_9AGAM|nr:hypothetical protein SCHPADRAFT_673487 [Schizopora paradoxa]